MVGNGGTKENDFNYFPGSPGTGYQSGGFRPEIITIPVKIQTRFHGHFFRCLPGKNIHLPQESSGLDGYGGMVHPADSVKLNQFAVQHHPDFVGHAEGLLLVVHDGNGGGIKFFLGMVDKGGCLPFQILVKVGKGFI